MHFSFRSTPRVNAGVGGEMAFESRGRPPQSPSAPHTQMFDAGTADGTPRPAHEPGKPN
jgi:hypothetical protein